MTLEVDCMRISLYKDGRGGDLLSFATIIDAFGRSVTGVDMNCFVFPPSIYFIIFFSPGHSSYANMTS